MAVLNSEAAEDTVTYSDNFLNSYADFIDENDMYLEARRYAILRGYTNLILKTAVLKQIIKQGNFTIYNHKSQFQIADAISGKIQNIANNIIKEYINKFYADKEKNFLSEFLTFDMLEEESKNELFPANQRMIIKVPKKHESFIKELKESIKDIYIRDSNVLPSIHFDKHLYSPIVTIAEGKKFKEIKTIPVRLNEGETIFLKHFREFLKESKMFEDKEVFILRNLSKKGLGFFMESSTFYPDFIIWVIDGMKQFIYFLDPKGIMLGENHFNNSKILWCKYDVKNLEEKIQNDLIKNKTGISVSISAFILSVTSYNKLRNVWSDGGIDRKDFTVNKVLFIEKSKEYLEEIFNQLKN